MRLITSILAISLMIALSGCYETLIEEEVTAQMDERGERNDYYFHKPGAPMPDGLELIKPGMSGDQVLLVLSPRYQHLKLDFRPPSEPGFDYFTYMEDGVTKYIEIEYSPVVVVYVRYGFTEPMPIY